MPTSAKNIPQARGNGIFFALSAALHIPYRAMMFRKKRHMPVVPAQGRTTEHPTASFLYLITGLGALTTAVGMMLCGKRSRALLIAQWVAPLLLTAAEERRLRRKKSKVESDK